MRILLTGSSGFVGSRFRQLYNKKFEIIEYDKKIGMDILDIKKLYKYMKKCDMVVHLAALISVGESNKKPLDYLWNNCIGTKNVFILANLLKKRVIYASSASVYLNDSIYAKTKIINESDAKNIDSLGLRFFNIYGNGSRSVVSTFLKSGKKPLTVFDGRQTRDFVHIDDVCRAIYIACRYKGRKKITDIGTCKETSINHLATMISNKIVHKETEEKITRSKAKRSVIGFKSKIKLEEGIWLQQS